ncbi:MAG TPA: translocation/assembly module TamB domain-containing protein, partial [Blastocatellia bacterium]|nr:translocation/assembly module TamB domain-containing protein [Blastocatellia bacterium]
MSSKLPRWRKRFLIALLGLFLLGGIAGISAWLWLRSEKFNQFVAGEIKAKLLEFGLRGEIGSFGFAWDTQTARLKDLKIYNQQTNQLLATVGSLEVQTEIRDLYALKLNREVTLKKLSLNGVEVFLEIDEQGKTNLEGVHNAPPKSEAITFDSTNLIAALTGGAVHFKDRQHKLETDLANLKINAQLSPQAPDAVNLQLTADDSRARFENRDLGISKLNLTARVAPAGVEVEQVSLDSTVGEVKAKGKLEDFNALRYGFDVESRLRLAELAQFAFPGVILRGPAAVNGKVEGEGAKYGFKGNVRSEDLLVENTKLRGVELSQVVAAGDADKLNLTLARANVQSLAVDIVEIGGIALGEVKGEIKLSGKNSETKITAPAVNVASVSWPDSKLTDLRLSNVTTNLLGANYEVNADATLGGGNISGAQVQSATAKAAFDNTALTVSQIKASALGGTVEAEYVLPLAKGAPQRVKGAFANLLTADVLAVAKVKDAPVTGQTSGEVELSFSGSDLRSLDGKVSARFEGKANEKAGDIPLTGNVAITAARGVFTFEQFQLATGATKLTANGTLLADGESDLRVSLLAPESEQLVQIARSFEAARPFIIENEPQLLGELKFEGRVTGKIETPTVEGDVSAATVGLRDALLGGLSGHVTASASELRVRNGLISAPNGGAAKFDLLAPLDPKAETGNLTATIDRISLETILAAAGAPNAEQFVSGDVSGSANLTGLPGKLVGSATLNLNNGTVAKQPAQLAIADLKFDGQQALLERLEVRLPQTRLNVTGKLNLDDYAFQTQGKVNQISLATLAESFELNNAAVEGFADAEFQVSGKLDQLNQARKAPEFDWESLKVELSAIGQNVRVNGRDAGALRLTAHTSPGGRLDAELVTGILATVTKDKSFKPEILKASIELRKTGRPVVIESELTDLDLSPIIATFAPDIGSQVRGALTGKLRVEGPTADAQGNSTTELLRGGMTLSAIKLDVLDSPVNIQTPLVIALDRQRLTIPATPITGNGIDLKLGGAIGLGDETAMNFALNGTLNLERLPSATTDVFLSGAVNIDARLTGTAAAPVLNGAVGLKGFGLSTRNLPVFLSNGVGTLRLTGDQITLENFSADANDGRLTGGGVTKLAGFAPAEWKYNFKLAEAAIYYEEFNATVNGDLTLTGTPQGQRLDGSITVPQGEYVTRLDLDNLIGGGASNLGGAGFNLGGAGAGAQSSLIPPTRLNLRVEARDSLLVRGNQINAAGSALMTIGGTLSDPDPRGRIETESGLVRFRGQRYEITRGTLDLPAGNNQTPVLDLVAES